MKKHTLGIACLLLAIAGSACRGPLPTTGLAPSPRKWTAQAASFNENGHSQRRLAVKLRSSRMPQLLQSVTRSGPQIVDRIPALGVLVLETAPTDDAARVSDWLSQDQDVVWAHPTVAIQAEGIPNDPLVVKQTHLPQIKAFDAWNVSTGDPGQPLAILDTGVDLAHPEFEGRIHPASRNILDNNDRPDDDYGHGNHVAGIAAATANNNVGVAGVAPGASLMIVKVMDASGRGDDATFAAGMTHAVDHGARVVSMSFGCHEETPLFQAALQYALDHDVVLVASAGNDHQENDPKKRPHIPSTFPGVIEVAATDERDKRASFSNYGKSVSVCAPGVNILSTYRLKFGGYGTFTGTSMATPMVAALATLVRTVHPTWTREQVRSQIEKTADDLGEPGRDNYFGAGRINCARALGAQISP